MTGDYVVGGVGLRGLGGANGLATGNITIPDATQAEATGVASPGVPAGADIVAAFLYWETIEKSKSAFAGQQGFFNGYPITGVILGNPNAPTSWSSGGCAGASNGTTTMRTYRADVRPFLPRDTDPSSPTFGQVLANNSNPGFPVALADSGSNGGGTPLTLGATLVIIYRVLSPTVPMPLNSIVLYDGAFAPSNSSSSMIQPINGFYQAAASPVAKITHIVGNGQPNKSESVLLNTTNLTSLYGTLPPFPGIYNGSWDNPTWSVNSAVQANDASEMTSVVPAGSNSGCVNWGTVIFSSTVQDSDSDGLLDVWEDNQGYTDALTGQLVLLPGANKSVKDMFVEIDYLSNLDLGASSYKHSHLPKQAALDMVGKAFKDAPVDCDLVTKVCKGVHAHFDVGNVYQSPLPVPGAASVICGGTQANPVLCDPYIVSNPAGTGGNAMSESLFVCSDGATFCAFPGQPAFAWKGDFLYVRNNATVPDSNPPIPLGNFQPEGRKDSYHYVLFGHALAEPRSFWGTAGNGLSNPILNPNIDLPQLVSIVDSGTTATVTLQSPPGTLKPGDPVNLGDPAFGDANLLRVTVTGAIGQPSLNGTYLFSGANSTPGNSNGSTTTVFTIPTMGVADGTYTFNNEPQLGVSYAGPTSTSGHSDFEGGADSAVTFGKWAADDPPNCQPDPSVRLASQNYCIDQVGTTQQQAGTLMHEVGHTLTLTHGGTYFLDPGNPFVPTFGLNCKSNVLSIMSYLFQARGFPDGGIGYSSQVFSPLDESLLNESTGIGLDSLGTGKAALHFTRWYAPPNALDTQIQNTLGGRFATRHCDGTVKTDAEHMVRVDGSTFSSPIDWNNNLTVPDPLEPVAWQDVNFNGSTAAAPDAAFAGMNDWQAVDLRQMGARASAFGFSGGGGIGQFGGGGIGQFGGGGIGQFGGGGISQFGGGGIGQFGGGGIGQFGGGGIGQFGGGGAEQDTDTANSTADAPTGLTAALSGHFVILNWTAPAFGQVRRYDIWRATGSFPTPASVVANFKLFSTCATCNVKGTPPSTTFTDTTVKNNTTYTYFVTDKNKQGAQSGASAPTTIFVKF